MAQPQEYPSGWDEERVQGVLAHYEGQTDQQAAEEDDAALQNARGTMMEVPLELVPTVRELIAERAR